MISASCRTASLSRILRGGQRGRWVVDGQLVDALDVFDGDGGAGGFFVQIHAADHT